MILWLFLLLPGQVVDSEEFSKELQLRATAATVRIVNRGERIEGSGVILGQKDKAVYILTAAHLVNRPTRLEISTFSADSYPRPAKIYDKAEVVAHTKDTRDLALIRVTADDLPTDRLPLCPPRLLPKKDEFTSLSVGCGVARAPVCLLETVKGAKSIRRQAKAQAALFWETAGEQAAGRSGGPLLDRQGHVLGIASGASRGKGYYCHATEIHRWLKTTAYRFLLPEEEKTPEK
jgi:hypothetical protein